MEKYFDTSGSRDARYWVWRYTGTPTPKGNWIVMAFKDFVVQCMTCPKTETVSAPEGTGLSTLFLYVVYEKNWAQSINFAGVFICCPECYPKCFDTKIGGNVGQLKPINYCYCIPNYDERLR